MRYLPASTHITAIRLPNPKVKKTSMPASPIWDFFVRNVQQKEAMCVVCRSVVRVGNGTTSGLMYHLKSVHPDSHKSFLEKRQVWEQLKDYCVYQNYLKQTMRKKRVRKILKADDTDPLELV